MIASFVHVARGYKWCVRVNNWGTISPEERNVLYRTGCLGVATACIYMS